MKAFGAAIVVLVTLYVADQNLAQGKYTYQAERLAAQIRHSMGL
jgi:hypothetical protein